MHACGGRAGAWAALYAARRRISSAVLLFRTSVGAPNSALCSRGAWRNGQATSTAVASTDADETSILIATRWLTGRGDSR